MKGFSSGETQSSDYPKIQVWLLCVENNEERQVQKGREHLVCCHLVWGSRETSWVKYTERNVSWFELTICDLD